MVGGGRLVGRWLGGCVAGSNGSVRGRSLG